MYLKPALGLTLEQAGALSARCSREVAVAYQRVERNGTAGSVLALAALDLGSHCFHGLLDLAYCHCVLLASADAICYLGRYYGRSFVRVA